MELGLEDLVPPFNYTAQATIPLWFLKVHKKLVEPGATTATRVVPAMCLHTFTPFRLNPIPIGAAAIQDKPKYWNTSRLAWQKTESKRKSGLIQN